MYTGSLITYLHMLPIASPTFLRYGNFRGIAREAPGDWGGGGQRERPDRRERDKVGREGENERLR